MNIFMIGDEVTFHYPLKPGEGKIIDILEANVEYLLNRFAHYYIGKDGKLPPKLNLRRAVNLAVPRVIAQRNGSDLYIVMPWTITTITTILHKR